MSDSPKEFFLFDVFKSFFYGDYLLFWLLLSGFLKLWLKPLTWTDWFWIVFDLLPNLPKPFWVVLMFPARDPLAVSGAIVPKGSFELSRSDYFSAMIDFYRSFFFKIPFARLFPKGSV
jgi:hypothetical protein